MFVYIFEHETVTFPPGSCGIDDPVDHRPPPGMHACKQSLTTDEREHACYAKGWNRRADCVDMALDKRIKTSLGFQLREMPWGKIEVHRPADPVFFGRLRGIYGFWSRTESRRVVERCNTQKMDNKSLSAEAAQETPQPASSPDEPTKVNLPIGMRSLATTLLAVLAVILALRWAQDIIVPFVIGILISYALSPPVTWMSRLKIPRAVGAALLLTAFIAGAVMLSYPLGEEGAVALEKLPKSLEKVTHALERSTFGKKHSIQKALEAASEIGKLATDSGSDSVSHDKEQHKVPQVNLAQPERSIRQYLWLGSTSAMEFVGQMVLILFLIYYLLVCGDFFKRKLIMIAGPTFAAKRITVQILDEINTQIQRFLLVQLFASVLVGTGTWIAFLLMGMEYSGFWGIAAGVLHTIPYFGPSILIVGSGLMAFLQFETFKMAILISGTSAVIAGLVGMLLIPWITSRAARMNAGAVFITLLFWNWIWGVWGLLLGIPITVALKTVCDHIESLNSVGKLLGD